MSGSRIIPVALIAALLSFGPATAGEAGEAASEDNMTRIQVIVGDDVLPVTLDDTPAAREFADMLPLELTLSDFHGIEKVADLGRQLDATGLPASYEPKAGDITQYRPWGNLAIFYKPFSDSRGLLRLGEFDGPIDALIRDGEFQVRIEHAD